MRSEPLRATATTWALAWVLAAVLGGCVSSSPIGPGGLQPEVEKKLFSLWPEFTPVDSTTPRLAWETFPDYLDTRGIAWPEGMEPDTVRYELMVWETVTGESGTLVYHVDGIAEPEHRIDRPLKPGTRYLWSVRASFTAGGQRRFSPWAQWSNILSMRTPPGPACYRFVTP